MEFEGIMVQALPKATGTSARGEWVSQDIVFEQPGDFGRKVCVRFWGDKVQDAERLVPGERVKLSVNVESREYNGRWYTDLRVWKMERAAVGAPASGYAAGAPQGGYGAPQGGGAQGYGAPAQGYGAQQGVQAPAPAQGSQHTGTEYDWGTPNRTAATPQEAPASKEEFDDLPF